MFVAQALEVVPVEGQPPHLLFRRRRLDGNLVVNTLHARHVTVSDSLRTSLFLAHLTQRMLLLPSRLQLPPLAAVVYLRFVLLLLDVGTSP